MFSREDNGDGSHCLGEDNGDGSHCLADANADADTRYVPFCLLSPGAVLRLVFSRKEKICCAGGSEPLN